LPSRATNARRAQSPVRASLGLGSDTGRIERLVAHFDLLAGFPGIGAPGPRTRHFDSIERLMDLRRARPRGDSMVDILRVVHGPRDISAGILE
jgi:plasmid stabilization system protein ParE